MHQTLETLGRISQPTLLLDTAKALANLERIAAKCRAAGVALRPHFKTHQSRMIGRWFRDFGIHRIAVTNTGMARYFLEDGWTDITIAMPVNLREASAIDALAMKADLGIVVVDATTLNTLANKLRHPVRVWIKFDVGTHRTGLNPADLGQLDHMIALTESWPVLRVAGFMAHAGHAYRAHSRDEVKAIHQETVRILSALKDRYISAHPDLQVSVGDTPAAGYLDDFGAVDELRPGNFIFYDLMQADIGACTLDDIAVAMACPIIAQHKERHQWVIHGGAIHFSKDALMMPDGKPSFGQMVFPDQAGWTVKAPGVELPRLVSLSQEHGIVQCSPEMFSLYAVGHMALWLPVHSCLTADAMGGYVTTTGERVDHYRAHVNEQ